MKNRKLEWVNAIVFAVSVLGINILNLYSRPIPWWVLLIATIALSVFYVFIARKKEYEKSYTFKENSAIFYDHFSRWYNQEGTLSLYCNDLDWLGKENGAIVVNKLAEKAESNHLNLYLRKYNGKIAKELLKKGAIGYIVSDDLMTQHRLSLLEHDGIKKIIIRNKETSDDKIVFIETSDVVDPYLISLVQDLLSNCQEKYELN